MHTTAALGTATAQVAPRTHSLVRDATLFLLTIGFICSTRFRPIAPLHTGHLAALVLFASFGIRYGRLHLPVTIGAFALFASSIAVYSAIVATVYGHEPAAFVTICISMIVYLAFGFHLAALAARWGVSREQLAAYLLWIVAAAVVLNSVVCLAEAFSRPFKIAVEQLMIDDSPLPYITHPFKVRGFVAGAGAGLSVANALAILIVIHLTWHRRINILLGFVFSAVVLVSTIFIGRTGLLFGIAFFVFQIGLVLYMSKKDPRSRGIAILTLGACMAAIYYASTVFTLNAEVAGWAFEWYDALAQGSYSTSSTDALQTMLYLPDNPIRLLFGVGFFEGTSRVVQPTDSGYVRTILVLGLPLATLLYAVVTGLIARVARTFPDTRPLVTAVIIVLLIVEVKEPFFYQNVGSRMLFLLAGAAIFAGTPNRRSVTGYTESV